MKYFLIFLVVFSLQKVFCAQNTVSEVIDWVSLFSPYRVSNESLQSSKSPFVPLIVNKKLNEEKTGEDPLVQYDLSQLQLIGIIWSTKSPKAMVLAPDQKIYTVSENQRMGTKQGYVSKIKEGQIVVIENISVRGKRTASTKVLQLKE